MMWCKDEKIFQAPRESPVLAKWLSFDLRSDSHM